MIRALLPTILLSSFLATLSSCGKSENEHSPADVKRLSTDVHVEIAQHTLTLPFIALEDYAYQRQSFSLNRKGEKEHALSSADKLLRDAADPNHPWASDNLSVVVRTYGWNDSDMSQRQMCPLLTREWARSVCDNPWAAIQQALPENRFRLVDLRNLRIDDDPRGPAQCINNAKPHRPLPQNSEESTMGCEKQVFGGDPDEFHNAVVRIDGDLGALWTVWRHGQNGETAEAMTEREGKAIVTFVRYALGSNEDFSALHATMCNLRRPGSTDSPKGADCEQSTLPSLSRNQELR